MHPCVWICTHNLNTTQAIRYLGDFYCNENYAWTRITLGCTEIIVQLVLICISLLSIYFFSYILNQVQLYLKISQASITRYALEEFVDGIEIVASNWLNEEKDMCMWPQYNDGNRIKNAATKKEVPSDGWSNYEVLKVWAFTGEVWFLFLTDAIYSQIRVFKLWCSLQCAIPAFKQASKILYIMYKIYVVQTLILLYNSSTVLHTTFSSLLILSMFSWAEKNLVKCSQHLKFAFTWNS